MPKEYFSLLLLALMPAPLYSQGPVLSEILASNQDGLEDEDGETPDWIEIYNPGNSILDLGGSYLTDDAGNLARWAIPSPTLINAGDCLLIFASGKDRAVSGTELHTNFKLSAGGEYLALVQPDGVTIEDEFAPGFPPQFRDVAYGLRFNPGLSTDMSYFPTPTPGSTNGMGGPYVQEVGHKPESPGVNDDIIVTAKILDAGVPVNSATLHARVMYSPESPLVLTDNGVAPDLQAGDGLWTAQISAGTTFAASMVRWRVDATDLQNGAGKAPLNTIPESAEYFGTVIEDPSATSTLRTIYWFVENYALADTSTGTRCSLWFENQFYDNQFCRLRGASTASYPKKSYKIDFNSGEKIRMYEGVGRMEEINLNSTWSDKSYIRQLLSSEIYQKAGAKTSIAEMVQLRQNGNLKGLYAFIEQVDDDFLDRIDLDQNGALYKMGNSLISSTFSVEKQTRTWENNQDLQDLVINVNVNNSVPDFETYLFDNIDLPSVISYLVGTSLMNDNDHVAKNYYLYRDSEGDLEWHFLPWDKDLTWGRNFTLTGGVLNDDIWADIDPQCHPLFGDKNHPSVGGFYNRLINACYSVPRVREMFVRRLWSIMDEQLQSPSTPNGQLLLENRISALQQLLASEVALDQSVWGSPSWGSPMTFQQGLDQITQDYLPKRRNHLYKTHTQSGVLPGAPTSVTSMILGAMETDPVSGDDDEEWLQLLNPTSDAIDLSGWTLTGGIDLDFHPGTVVPAGDSVYLSPKLEIFRARASSPTGNEGNFVIGPYDGNLKAGEDLFLWDADGNLITSTSAAFTLFIGDLIPGQSAIFNMAGANSNAKVVLGWSSTGSGPTSTPWGFADLSPPIHPFPTLTADFSGSASMQATVPSNTTGLQIWFQALDLTAGLLSNGESRVIQ